jgi:AAA domain
MGDVIAFTRKSRFAPEPFLDIVPHVQPWRVKGVLPSRGVAFVVGQSKAGKSFLAIDAMLRLAAGAKVFGRKANRCGVVYVAAEDAHGCRSRVTAWRLKNHRSSPTPFVLLGQGLNLLDEADTADLKATLTDLAADFSAQDAPLGVVVFDTLSRCIPGVDENSSMDMSRAFGVLDDIATHIGALVLVVAHFGKAGGDKGIRGWSGFDANSDATIAVERDSDDPNLRLVTFAKVKNGVDGGRLAFRLETVGLGTVDEDGDEITSCVPVYEVATEAQSKPRRARALNPPEQIVLSAVRYVTDNGTTQPLPDIDGAKPWQKAVRRGDVKTRAIASGLAGDSKPDTVLKRFNRAIEGLSATRKVRVEGDLLWLL